jgi:hypothetical protein
MYYRHNLLESAYCLAYSSTLKVRAEFSFESPVTSSRMLGVTPQEILFFYFNLPKNLFFFILEVEKDIEVIRSG